MTRVIIKLSTDDAAGLFRRGRIFLDEWGVDVFLVSRFSSRPLMRNSRMTNFFITAATYYLLGLLFLFLFPFSLFSFLFSLSLSLSLSLVLYSSIHSINNNGNVESARNWIIAWLSWIIQLATCQIDWNEFPVEGSCARSPPEGAAG